MRVRSIGYLLLAAGVLLPSGAIAQDPASDLPARRVAGTQNPGLQLGVARLQAGWPWEAVRVFRGLQTRDDSVPLPHLLMAVAMRSAPNRAARHCFDAMARREKAGVADQKLVDAYQGYFGVTNQPELKDARFQRQPDQAKARKLIAVLRGLASEGSAGWLAGELAELESARLSDPVERTDEQRLLLLQHHHALIKSQRAMPFMVPGYQQLLAQVVGDSGKPSVVARVPRHPHHQAVARYAGILPGFAYPDDLLSIKGSKDQLQWQPPLARGFDLPRGLGGRASYADYRGRPLLIVFFLGFGCAHCVAQLSDLDPLTPKFRAAGIEVVTIGTDDLDQVKAARQAADENGVDPLHFDVLCDHESKVFKQWGVWDEFSNEALHGTFLLDGKGRILWQDISVRPFEDSDWLLAESQRLLTAWK